MSKISKISIKGIRSYSPATMSSITFDGPLTIILGPNGSGKTTIIESLKYITTGDVPTGCKLNSFVHDPKINGESEVKGIVKLEFVDIKANKCVCTRSLISVQKQKKVESRSLEGSFVYSDQNGKNISMSSRCIDLSHEMINHLGVSKALLENVIFCHQEISTWPLSEPKILKEKFDAIFSATKYIKALESIRDTRKNQCLNVKEMTNELIHLENKKVKLEELRNKLTDYKIKYGLVYVDVEKLEKQLKEWNLKNDKVDSLMGKIKKKMGKLEKYQSLVVIKKEVLDELKDKIEQIVNLSMDDLQLELSNLIQSHDDQDKKLLKYNEKMSRLNDKVEQYESFKKEHQLELANQSAIYKNAQADLDCCITNISNVAQLHKIGNICIDNITLENVSKIGDIVDEIKFFLNSKLSVEQTNIDTHKDKLSANENELNILNLRLNQLKNDKNIQENLKLSIEKKLLQKKSILSEIDPTYINRDILSKKIQYLNSKTEFIDKLNNELDSLTLKDKDLKCKLDDVQKKYFDMKKVYDNSLMASKTMLLIEECEKQLLLIDKELKNMWEDSNFEEIKMKEYAKVNLEFFSNCQKYAKSQFNFENEEISRISNDICLIDYKIDEFNIEISICNEKINENLKKQEYIKEKIISLHGSYDTVDNLLCHYRGMLKKKKESLSKLKASKEIYRIYIDSISVESNCDSCCPLCERSFQSNNEKINLDNKIKCKLDNLIESEATLVYEIETYDSIIDQLINFSEFDAINVDELVERCQNIRKEIEKLKNNKSQIKLELNANEKKIKINYFDSLMTRILSLNDIYSKKMSILEKYELHKTEIMQYSNIENVPHMKNKLDELEVDRVNCQKKLNDNRDVMLSKQHVIYEENKLINELKNELKDMEQKISSKEELIVDIEEKELKLVDIIQKCNNLYDEINKLENTISNKLFDIANQKKAIQNLTNDFNIVKSDYHSLVINLENQYNRISKFNYTEYNKEIKYMNSILEKKSKKINKKLQKISKTKNNIDILQENMVQFDNKIRHFKDNIEIKKLSIEIEHINVDINLLKNKISEIGSFDELETMRKTYQQNIEQIKEKIYHSKGVMEGLKNQIDHLENEINDKFYADVDILYHKKSSLLKITELAGNDLEKYYKALDNAIMKFHALKMNEINKLIKEYWMRTYHGNDITTIEIRSEQDESNNSISVRRLYNYKVVMIKNGICLDMRGRCSSGQKMLASIIIRLALAETFCANCGVITLDEPTTNLDHMHIRELSKSLIELANSRRESQSFQLIVITHDEEFVNTLCRANLTDYYYQIHKDINGYSNIKRLNVNNLFD